MTKKEEKRIKNNGRKLKKTEKDGQLGQLGHVTTEKQKIKKCSIYGDFLIFKGQMAIWPTWPTCPTLT